MCLIGTLKLLAFLDILKHLDSANDSGHTLGKPEKMGAFQLTASSQTVRSDQKCPSAHVQIFQKFPDVAVFLALFEGF